MKYAWTQFTSGMHEFGSLIAIIVNSLLLSIAYVVGVGPTTLISKFFGKKFLETRLTSESSTYWNDIEQKPIRMDDYFRQS
jgi:hypothetical protein